MKNSFILCLLASFSVWLLLVSPCHAEQPKLEVVVVRGVGTTPEEARENALVQAVSTVVGLMVVADTQVENEEVVKDQILTHSRGFVKTFSELGEPLKQDDGTYHLRITATVARTELLERLRKANIQLNQMDGKGLFAESSTRELMTKRGLTLLEEVFKGLPENLLVAKVKSREIVKTGDPTRVRLTLEVGYDSKAYYEQVMPAIRQVLDQVSTRKAPNEQTEKNAIVQMGFGDQRHIGRAEYQAPQLKEDQSTLRFNTSRNLRGDMLRWQLYLFEDRRFKEVFQEIEQRRPKLRVSFLDDRKRIVLQEDINISELFGRVNQEALNYLTSTSDSLLSKQISTDHSNLVAFKRSLDGKLPDIKIPNVPSFLHDYSKTVYGLNRGKSDGSYGLAPFVVFRIGEVSNKGANFLEGRAWYENFYSDTLQFDWEFIIPLDELENIQKIKTFFIKSENIEKTEKRKSDPWGGF